MTETPPRRARRSDFHHLTVKRVEPLTDDSAAITLTVPDDLAGAFAFAAGQSLTVRHGEERRTYSICAPAGSAPRIGVREVAGGAVSGWLVHALKPGDILEVQAPSYALEQREIDAGDVLTCQALPTTGEITGDYDA